MEENAATAKTLEHQAKAMDDRAAAFRIDGSEAGSRHPAQPANAGQQRPAAAPPSRGPAAPKQQPAAAPKPGVAPGANGSGPVGRMQAGLATALKEAPDWKEF